MGGELALAFGDEARGRVLDRLPEPGGKGVLVEPGRDRIERLDHDGAGIAAERPARPEQARIERERHACHAGLGIQWHDTELVARLGPRSAAAPFWKNDDLASARELRPRARGHL